MTLGNTIVFSHEQDVDGVLSAAILKIAFSDAEIVLTNYGLENMLDVGRKITDFIQSKPPGRVIVADMGPNVESYKPVLSAMTAAKNAGWYPIWIDHHVWPEGLSEEISHACEVLVHHESPGSPKKCTAELCAERFLPADKLAFDLAKIAHRTDFPDSDRFPIPPLTTLIAYYVGFAHLHERLQTVILQNVTRGILWNTEMQNDVIEASRLTDESIQRSVDGMQLREIHDGAARLVVAIARSDQFVSRSILLGRIMDENNIDLAFAYTDDGKLSIRRKDGGPSGRTDVDCSAVARLFREGGGHAGAAGGFLAAKPDTDGPTAAVNEIVQAVESYVKSLT